MARILYVILFVCSGISFAAEHHNGHDKTQSQRQSCHEKCKAQYPDTSSDEHKACMNKCKNDQK